MNTNEKLTAILKKRILIIDGAMGTQIQKLNLTDNDFGGKKYFGCNDYLNLTKPEIIQKIHEEYLKAGADIIETNSFGASEIVLKEYGLDKKIFEINFKAAQIAKKATLKFNDKFVAGAIGPTTRSLSLAKKISPKGFDELVNNFEAQITGLIKGGVDILLFETFSDTLNLKAALITSKNVQKKLNTNLPVMISVTIEKSGSMLAGQTIEALLASIEHFKPFSVGINCGLGPDATESYLKSLSKISPFYTSIVPNAGLPDQNGNFTESPKLFAKKIQKIIDQNLVNFIGGCCGSTPEHIKKLANLNNINIRKPAKKHQKNWLSGIDFFEAENDLKPILVGERTNSIGSKKFRDLIANDQYELAAEIGSKQTKNGASIIDLCLANPERNENDDFQKTLSYLIKKTRAPIMIDSTDAEVIENALKIIQGKAVINSINFENGNEKFEQIANFAKKFGTTLVIGTIDEKGMGTTKQRKMAIINRAYKLLIKKLEFDENDIIFDALVFPLGTGKMELEKSAIQTFETIKEVKKTYKNCQTILGISNCSFGLPTVGREIINSVYLYEATKAGLDFAIVNTEKLARYSSINKSEKLLAEDLIFNRKKDALEKFANYFRNKKIEPNKSIEKNLTPEKLIKNNILEGVKTGLIENLEILIKKTKPLDIVNKLLMPAMSEVGKLFNKGELIVSEVLQSAEVMKTAINYLEQFIDSKDSVKAGKILLATVKGDVHDIGKNLVEIIFSNNGYEVIDLGIKVSATKIIEEAKKHQPDIIGLSGLLVKSCIEMIETAKELKNSGISTTLIVGGAALSKNFTSGKILPAYKPGNVIYCPDAISALDLIRNEKKNFAKKYTENKNNAEKETIKKLPKKIRYSKNIPEFFGNQAHILKPKLEDVFANFNLQMLFGKHLGYKGNFAKGLENKDKKAVELWKIFQDLKNEIAEKNYLKPKSIFKFFRAHSDKNKIFVDKKVSFNFPRQKKDEQFCLSDFINSENDMIAFFVSTSGNEILSHAMKLKNKGEFLKSYFLQAIALETAEALAEITHNEIRKLWKIKESQGERFSFGYSACPNLDDQKKLFELLNPQKIGVKLTENFMMQPEASVSAIVFHSPCAEIFYI